MKVRKNMQRGLATRLHDLSTTFRRVNHNKQTNRVYYPTHSLPACLCA